MREKTRTVPDFLTVAALKESPWCIRRGLKPRFISPFRAWPAAFDLRIRGFPCHESLESHVSYDVKHNERRVTKPAISQTNPFGGCFPIRDSRDRSTLMPAFTDHLFICCNRRSAGHRRGCCDPAGTETLRNTFKAEIKKRGLNPLVRANKAGCLDQCEHGPCVVIYPQGIFYGNVTLADVDRIIERTVIGGEILDDLLVAEECLNNRACEHITNITD